MTDRLADAIHYELDVCIDCLALIANGECETPDPGWDPSDVSDRWDGFHLMAACEPENLETMCGSFSWMSCDGCGSTLGGERHQVIALPIHAPKEVQA